MTAIPTVKSPQIVAIPPFTESTSFAGGGGSSQAASTTVDVAGESDSMTSQRRTPQCQSKTCKNCNSAVCTGRSGQLGLKVFWPRQCNNLLFYQRLALGMQIIFFPIGHCVKHCDKRIRICMGCGTNYQEKNGCVSASTQKM